MAGVRPAVCPKDLCHFFHGLLACVSSQVLFTAVLKLLFLDGLGVGANESDLVFLCEFVVEFVMLEFDAGEEFDLENPCPVKLGICARRSGAF